VLLIGRFRSPVVVAVAMFTAVVATLAVNIAANVVSPANDFANAFPRLVSFKTGGLITGILGIVIMPWKLLADPSGYIYTWLLGYSGGLGSIAGVLIADYWFVRRGELQLEDLYLSDGVYRGWNWRAIAATLVGTGLAWSGFVIPFLAPLFDYAWFVGFIVSAVLHVVLMKEQGGQAGDAEQVARAGRVAPGGRVGQTSLAAQELPGGGHQPAFGVVEGDRVSALSAGGGAGRAMEKADDWGSDR
jgi:cytosine/uracil/thiamine/allantoin permease